MCVFECANQPAGNLVKAPWGQLGSRFTVETSPALRPGRSQRRKPTNTDRRADRQTGRQTGGGERQTDRQKTSDNSTKSTLISYLNIVEAGNKKCNKEKTGRKKKKKHTDRQADPMVTQCLRAHWIWHHTLGASMNCSRFLGTIAVRCMPSTWTNRNGTSCPRDIRPKVPL